MKHHGGHKGHHHGHHRAGGGRTHEIVSGNPDVIKEAEGEESYAKGDEKSGDDRKHGGKVKAKHHGKHHRKHGGKVSHHEGHEMHGHHPHHRADHKPRGRKRGGGVGADRSPLSTAHKGHAGAGHGSSEPHDTYGGTPP
jgi:hypothetical protein